MVEIVYEVGKVHVRGLLPAPSPQFYNSHTSVVMCISKTADTGAIAYQEKN